MEAQPDTMNVDVVPSSPSGESPVSSAAEFAGVEDERDRLRAVLDLYQKALEDLRMFALQKSLGKHLEGDDFYSRLEAKIASPDFLNQLGNLCESPAEASCENQLQDDHSSWDIINEADLDDSRNGIQSESYVVVNQEDIIEGMACFMAKYVSSLPQTKTMSPKQLQSTLKKAFGAPRKGMLRRLWSGSKVLYTAASWGATAVSLYNNPMVVEAASRAFWASIQLVSKCV